MSQQMRTCMRAIACTIILSFSSHVIADAAVPAKVDAEAAEKLARKDKCLRCHGVTKQKEGPSFKSVAEKYRGDNGAADKLYKHITEGKDVVKLSDGHKEVHKFDGKHSHEELMNMVNWILSR